MISLWIAIICAMIIIIFGAIIALGKNGLLSHSMQNFLYKYADEIVTIIFTIALIGVMAMIYNVVRTNYILNVLNTMPIKY